MTWINTLVDRCFSCGNSTKELDEARAALAAEVARRDAETCRHVVEMQKLREEWDRLRAAAEAVLEQVEDGGCGDCVYCGEPVEACDFDNLDGDDESCKGFVLRRALTAGPGGEVG